MLRDLFSLFPAYAGVILRTGRKRGDKNAFPRICGGDPSTFYNLIGSDIFSPHMRG